MWNSEFLALVICAFLSNAYAAITSLERGKNRLMPLPTRSRTCADFVTGSQSGSHVCFDIKNTQSALIRSRHIVICNVAYDKFGT